MHKRNRARKTSQKLLSDLFTALKRIQAAAEKVQKANMSRVDLTKKVYQKNECVSGSQ